MEPTKNFTELFCFHIVNRSFRALLRSRSCPETTPSQPKVPAEAAAPATKGGYGRIGLSFDTPLHAKLCSNITINPRHFTQEPYYPIKKNMRNISSLERFPFFDQAGSSKVLLRAQPLTLRRLCQWRWRTIWRITVLISCERWNLRRPKS